jgi:hypothetical protein
MVDTVDSGTAFPGMAFRFKITVTARIDGILVPSGTIGYGVVREVTGASNHGRNGTLVLEIRELLYGNQVLQVMADPRESTVWERATTLTQRASDLVPVPGFVREVYDEMRDGRNVSIGPGFTFHILALGDPRKIAPCHKVGE